MRSRILGGGALTGAPLRRVSPRDSGRLGRSGELLPCFRLDRGARAGILLGLPFVFVPAATVGLAGVLRKLAAGRPAVGVLAPARAVGTVLVVVDLEATDRGALMVEGGAPDGVLERVPDGVLEREGGTTFLVSSSSSSSK